MSNQSDFLKNTKLIRPAKRLDVASFMAMYSIPEEIVKKRASLLKRPAACQEYVKLIPDALMKKYQFPFPERLSSQFYLKHGQIYRKEICEFEQITDRSRDISLIKEFRFQPPVVRQNNFFQFLYVYSGQCILKISKKSVELNNGDFCLIPPYVSLSTELCHDADIILEINLRADNFESIFYPILNQSGPLPLFLQQALNGKHANQYMNLHTFGDSDIREKFNQLIIEFVNKPSYFGQMMLNLLLEIFLLILRNHCQQFELGDDYYKNTAEALKLSSYMQENYLTANIENTAAYFGYTVPAFSRFIKKLTGQTFSALLRQVKIGHSKYFLLRSSKSIEDIACLCGYHSSGGFIHAFTRETGVTPHQYRKKHWK